MIYKEGNWDNEVGSLREAVKKGDGWKGVGRSRHSEMT
jgi:hypothetical protein